MLYADYVVSRADTLNAKVGAVAFLVAASLTLSLTHFSATLAPLRLMTLAVAAFAAWSFCDEMGLRKPLNRAGFVFFGIAAITKVQLTVGLSELFVARYSLLYATFLLLAVVFWSVALLHRQRTLKIVGAIGLMASLAPITAIVLGHVAVGLAAFLGVDALLGGTEAGGAAGQGFVTLVERIFGIWACVVACLLWRGYIQAPGGQVTV